jgi:hypothetical protein
MAAPGGGRSAPFAALRAASGEGSNGAPAPLAAPFASSSSASSSSSAAGGADTPAARFARMVAHERRLLLEEHGAPGRGGVVGGGGGPLQPPLPLRVPLKQLTVCVRKRPVNEGERRAREFDVLTCLPPAAPGSAPGRTVVVHEPRSKYDLSQAIVNHPFAFDAAFGEEATTAAIYDALLAPLVATLASGRQFTCFAYGQTGSGKSFTMGGLTHAAIDDVFALVHAPANRHRCVGGRGEGGGGAAGGERWTSRGTCVAMIGSVGQRVLLVTAPPSTPRPPPPHPLSLCAQAPRRVRVLL